MPEWREGGQTSATLTTVPSPARTHSFESINNFDHASRNVYICICVWGVYVCACVSPCVEGLCDCVAGGGEGERETHTHSDRDREREREPTKGLCVGEPVVDSPSHFLIML